MKKRMAILGAALLMMGAIAGCSSKSAAETTAETAKAEIITEVNAETAKEAEELKQEGAINVISRESGSGTRGAFIELFKIEEKNEKGEKVDLTTEEAEITNSTAVMMTSVAGDRSSIGYISLGSLNDTVKALDIDGAGADVDNIKSGAYKVSRPFNIVTTGNESELAADFIRYILSDEGQAVVEENGYISNGNAGRYEASGLSGRIVVAGSSSVTPVMEKLKEAYTVLNPDVKIEVQQSDSTTGVTNALDGICDIGMASRELKDSEVEKGAIGTVIALDGIAVIVNNENPIEELSSEQIKDIYTGNVTDWSEL